MLPFNTITVSPDEAMKQKRDYILNDYHRSKRQLEALWDLAEQGVIPRDDAYHYAHPIMDRLKDLRAWLDDYSIKLLDNCSLESTI